MKTSLAKIDNDLTQIKKRITGIFINQIQIINKIFLNHIHEINKHDKQDKLFLQNQTHIII